MLLGASELKVVDEWKEISGAKNWVRGKSAYELAHAWHDPARSRKLPHRVAAALDNGQAKILRRLKLAYLYVEHRTFLDTDKAPSCTDIMAYCRTSEQGLVVLGVEGKADESFDKTIVDWVHVRSQPEVEFVEPSSAESLSPTRARRLKHLGVMLGTVIPTTSELRYQLFHRTASTVQQAAMHDAEAAVVLIHSFSAKKPMNWQDYQDFVHSLGLAVKTKNELSGPAMLGREHGVATYFLWVEDVPTT